MRLDNKKSGPHGKGIIVLISDCPKTNASITANLSCNGYEVRTFRDPFLF
jgi:hypothetical protein